jgi:hypothetical protein
MWPEELFAMSAWIMPEGVLRGACERHNRPRTLHNLARRSAKTGHKIFNRYQACGLKGLADRRRRPYRHANRVNTKPVWHHEPMIVLFRSVARLLTDLAAPVFCTFRRRAGNGHRYWSCCITNTAARSQARGAIVAGLQV